MSFQGRLLRHDSIEELRERYRNIDMVLVDDIQFISGKAATQEEFFFIFDELHNRQKQIVIASNKPPKDSGDLIEGLKSRFSMGLVIDILPPDFDARVEIIFKKAKQHEIAISHDIARLLASRIHSDVRMLEGAIIRLSSYAFVHGVPIDLQTAEGIL